MRERSPEGPQCPEDWLERVGPSQAWCFVTVLRNTLPSTRASTVLQSFRFFSRSPRRTPRGKDREHFHCDSRLVCPEASRPWSARLLAGMLGQTHSKNVPQSTCIDTSIFGGLPLFVPCLTWSDVRVVKAATDKDCDVSFQGKATFTVSLGQSMNFLWIRTLRLKTFFP